MLFITYDIHLIYIDCALFYINYSCVKHEYKVFATRIKIKIIKKTRDLTFVIARCFNFNWLY